MVWPKDPGISSEAKRRIWVWEQTQEKDFCLRATTAAIQTASLHCGVTCMGGDLSISPVLILPAPFLLDNT